MNVNETKMGYSRVFSMGNYENEKISVECDMPEGMDTTEVYIELKNVVENAHNLRKELRDYSNAKKIMRDPDLYRGTEVKQAQETIKDFELKYPKISDIKVHALLSENGNPIDDDQQFE